MRQDAVMQQFFGLVNSLLARCESTARRGLKMITYKVWHRSLRLPSCLHRETPEPRPSAGFLLQP
jgi:hypothetical protein